MESNADKQLREKLKGVEYPFDPQAWEQMEAMLDEKKKRRGFFWWWFGGIAAALLITAGTIGYGLWLMGEEDRIARAEYAQEQELSESEKAVGSEQLAVSSSEEQMVKSKEQLANDNEEERAKGREQNENSNKEQLINGKEQKASGKEKTVNSKGQETNNKQRTANNKQQTKTSPAAKQNRKGNQQQRTKEVLEQLASNEANYSNSSVQTESATPAVPVSATQKEEALSLNTMYALLNGKDDALNTDKKEEGKLPKKKKWFTYSIGPMANVTGTILSNPFAVDSNARNRSAFSKGASFMAGFQQEFLFVDRIALTTGFLYSQTSFNVPRTNLDNVYSRPPLAYTCNISEMNITTGIKANLVAKSNVRFYVHTGFIHHIKLTEKFTYTYPTDTVPTNIWNGSNVVNNSTGFPTQTNFNGNTGYEAAQYDMLSGVTKSTLVDTEPFSVNNAKRYYASFYAATGVEYILKRRWVFFTEPMFFMGLQRIGIQERTKYNVGVSGGFRYQF